MNDAPVALTALQTELHALRQRVAELEAQQITNAEQKLVEQEEHDRNRTAALVRANEQLQAEIATREQVERSLRESEARWRLFVMHAPVAMAMLDRQMRYLAVSDRWQTEYGLVEQDLVGRSHYDVFPEVSEKWKAVHRRTLAGAVERGDEDQFVRDDGAVQWLRWEVQPWREPSGDIGGIIIFSEDITARKRAEDWTQSLIASTQDAVIAVDRQAHLVLFNQAAEKIFGYTAAEVVGEKVNLLMAEPYAHEHDGYIARYEETHEPRAIGRIRMVTGRRKSGEAFPLELSVTEIRSDQEVHYSAFIRDISEKVRLHEKAVEQERVAAIGVTVAKLTHEIGNPLNSMALSAQMLERRLTSTSSDDKSIERVRGLRDQIARLTQLLREFRHLSRRQDYRLEPTNLTHLVTEVLTTETEQYSTRGVTIVHDSARDLPFVKADADKLRQVLVNLCKNAVEAMPDGGTLTVRAQRNGNNQVHLHISDTGSGIPDGVNIFEPFITTKPEGTGLGLPVVRQIVAAHEGELSYRTALGQGTTFTVTLVAVDEQQPSPTEMSTSLQRNVERR